MDAPSHDTPSPSFLRKVSDRIRRVTHGRDRQVIYATSFLRSLSTGTVGILIGLYLAKTGLSPLAMGAVMGAGLAGNAAGSFLAMLAGDRLGRRRLLAFLAFLMGVGGLLVATTTHGWLLAAAAFVGMINANGRERGAGLILEQAMLPELTDDKSRTRAFANFNVAGDLGHCLGALLAMMPEALRESGAEVLRAPTGPPAFGGGLSDIDSLSVPLILCACIVLATVPLSLTLSRAVESKSESFTVPLAPQSKKMVWRISSLFFVDALGGGFITTAWLSYYFATEFHVGEVGIGALFFGARLLNAVSHVGAAWIAARIGLVRTMVATSLPSSFLLLTVLVAPTFPIAAALFLLREGLAQMDVPTRQSYVMAVVRSEERVRVSGITQLTRLGAWAVAPFVAGWLMDLWLPAPFIVGCALKIVYAVVLFYACRHVRPPEEQTETTTDAPAIAQPIAVAVAKPTSA